MIHFMLPPSLPPPRGKPWDLHGIEIYMILDKISKNFRMLIDNYVTGHPYLLICILPS